MTMKSKKPLVGIIMGSDSDWTTLEPAVDICEEFSIPYEVQVVSAHRTPDEMARYGKNAIINGLRVIIAAAGGAAGKAVEPNGNQLTLQNSGTVAGGTS